MGRILQIRVSAWTYDEDDVLRAWPRLCAAVWPELDKWAPVGGRRGVMELAEALPDVVRFGGWPEELKTRTAEAVRAVAKCREGLVQALADWKPEEANRLSDSLEEALDTLEKLMPTDA
ncbi:MAG TPA: hypothetical protein H9991_09320 [Candidatus Mailhella excrementigallinarum]|nr:MAG: hypothetical protein DBY37_00155 [Desulfovibrionaceae bacterium]HIV66444.1 hypothetical protein [Candidatus Mailhella excrementigallinarum]